MSEPTGTRPFAPFEWMLSLRYLRARRQEGFISVIAGFSFLGIMLGVATLIIVMAVMNGFRKELLEQDPRPQRPPAGAAAGDAADRLSGRGRAAAGRRRHPARGADRRGAGARLVAVQRRRRAGARHPRPGPQRAHLDRQQHQAGHAGGLRPGAGRSSIGRRLADQLTLRAGDNVTLVVAARRGDADGHHAAHQGLQDRRRVRDRHVGIRRRLRVHAAGRGAGLFQPQRRRHRDRGLHRQSRRGRRGSASSSPKPPSGRSSWSTGGSATPRSSTRCRSSAT